MGDTKFQFQTQGQTLIWCHCSLYIYLFIFLKEDSTYFLERERASTQRRVGGTGRLPAEQGARQGAQLQDPEITAPAEGRR